MENSHGNLRTSFSRFRFCDETFKFLEIIFIPFATPIEIKLIIEDFNIIKDDVLALLYMVILDRDKLVADTFFNRHARRRTLSIKIIEYEYTSTSGILLS